jgi:SAM-dependent methyltransferase
MSYEIAKNFWKGLCNYPKYPNVKERRLIDINFVVNNINNSNSIIDLGCADGYLLLALREFTYIKSFYGYDISQDMLKSLKDRWGNWPGLETKVCDFTEDLVLPKTDITVSMGMFPYIFNDEHLNNILLAIKSNTLIVRTPCTSKSEDEYINTFSDDLKANYSSVYRTPNNYLNILKSFYGDVVVERSYPDEIESKYGTKHFFFVCKR